MPTKLETLEKLTNGFNTCVFYNDVADAVTTDLFQNNIPFVIEGGAVRDWLTDKTPRDLDICVMCKPQQLKSIVTDLKGFHIKLNSFGGWKITSNSFGVDLWSHEKTWAYTKGYVKNTGIASLNKTVPFNFDTGLFSPYDDYVDVVTLEAGLSNKTLSFVLEANPSTTSVVMHAITLAEKYHLKMDVGVKKYVADELNKPGGIAAIITFQKKYYSSRGFFPENVLNNYR